MKTVLPDRRNPQAATLEGSGGRTPELRAPVLGEFYPHHVTECNTFQNPYTLRLTRTTAAGRKLAQMPVDHGLSRPPLNANKWGQSDQRTQWGLDQVPGRRWFRKYGQLAGQAKRNYGEQ